MNYENILKKEDISNTLDIISKKIKENRELLGMSKEEFSIFLGVPIYIVDKWESGEYVFNLKELNIICHKLGWKLYLENSSI